MLVRIGEQVLGGLDRRAAGGDQRHVQLARNAVGKRRLAQARRAVEQDVPQRLAPLAGRIDHDVQPLDHVALADHLVDPLGAEDRDETLHRGRSGGKDGFAGHGKSSFRFQVPSFRFFDNLKPGT